MSSNTINIHIEGQYGSISNDVEWKDIPPFAILTGVNGAGKTQLLEVLAGTYGALRSRHPSIIGEPRQPLTAQSIIEGQTFSRGEVFHSYGEWPQLVAKEANENGIMGIIRKIHGSKNNNRWLWETIAKYLGKSIDDVRSLSPEEFYEQLTPRLLWEHEHQRPGVDLNLSSLFLSYRLLERDAFARGLQQEEIRELFGEPPWDLINEILKTSGLPYQINSPELQQGVSLITKRDFLVCLRDIERNQPIPFHVLSSGETVIMSTALLRYGAEEIGTHHKLLLLDEPDAHLHPSLTRQFLDVIQHVFVEKRGVRVIMSTHSPTTVALAPPGSLFEMQRVAPRIRRAPSPAHAIAVLTDGFDVVQQSTQIVLLEGKDDPPFYREVWDLLTGRTPGSDQAPLEPSPNLIFIYGQGRETVRQIIPQMRSSRLLNFHGIIDRDKSNIAPDGVYVLNRNGMENYLFDPLNVFFVLHSQNKAPVVEGVSIPTGGAPYARNLHDDDLQKITDKILAIVEASITELEKEEMERQEVKFINGKRLNYPKWFLNRDDKEIAKCFRDAFSQPLLTDTKLLEGYRRLGMVPRDLFKPFKIIQGVNTNEPGK